MHTFKFNVVGTNYRLGHVFSEKCVFGIQILDIIYKQGRRKIHLIF